VYQVAVVVNTSPRQFLSRCRVGLTKNEKNIGN